MSILNSLLKQWKRLILGFILLDVAAVGLVLLYATQVADTRAGTVAELRQTLEAPTPTATATATPWPGPGRRITPTSTSFPTPMATDVLALSGFPPGFTPTPRPTREAVLISLPYVYPLHSSAVDVPIINQIYYPEPFFPPGSNNACGPVALYAALLGLGIEIDYTRLRDVAVNYGFTHYGISKSGMINTISTLNHEMNSPLTIKHSSNHSLNTLAQEIRRGGVPIVLIRVRKENGQFRVTADKSNSIGHFLIVESINRRSNTVRFAGSTLGMEKVPIHDFIQSWSSNPQAITAPPRRPSLLNPWQPPIKSDATNWALIVGRR